MKPGCASGMEGSKSHKGAINLAELSSQSDSLRWDLTGVR